MGIECAGAASAVELMPVLKCAETDAGLAGAGGKRDPALDVKSANPPALVAVQMAYRRCH